MNIDFNLQNGCSALRHSVETKSLLVLNLLLEHRADVDLPDTNGVTPLNVIITRNLGNQLQIVLNHYMLVATATRLDFCGSVLIEAVDRDVVDIVQLLLEDEHVSVEYQNAAGETAFHHIQSVQAFAMLCRFDPNSTAFHQRTATGDSCLHYAARLGFRHVLSTLLEHHERLKNGSTASFTDDLAVSTNAKGATPLFEAATNGSTLSDIRNRISELLLSFNAPLFPADWFPFTIEPTPSPSLSLVASVRACLELWLTDESGQDLTNFSANWIACAHFPSQHMSTEVLNLIIFAGFATDTVPLLVELPLPPVNWRKFVGLIGEFASRRNHRLLLQLYSELVAASTSHA